MEERKNEKKGARTRVQGGVERGKKAVREEREQKGREVAVKERREEEDESISRREGRHGKEK